jgi:hypothetical protein
MKRICSFLILPTFLLAPSSLVADSSTSGEPMVDWSPTQKLPQWLQLGGQIRGRFEAPSGTSMLNGSSDPYFLSRIRLDVGIRATPWLRFFAESQDARSAGYISSPAPNTIYNPMDLRQAYVSLGGEGTGGVIATVGRQELLFGGERLIGPADWGMSRTFDAARLTLTPGHARVDLFGGSSVLIDPTRFDRHKPGEHVYGAYGSIKDLLPNLTVEPYLLFKQTLAVKSETGHTGDALVASPGVRLVGKAPGRLDYTAEIAVQRGSYSTDRVAALGQSYVAGWTIVPATLAPRLSVEYNQASGDPSSKDGTRNTFDQFYPSNHGYYGMIDQFGWKNLKNWRAGFDCKATKKLKLRIDFNEFYLATVQDALYSSSGTSALLNRKATSGHIGSEINAVGLYQWTKVWKFGAGYGRLFAGEFLKQSKADFGYTYPYIMFVGSF